MYLELALAMPLLPWRALGTFVASASVAPAHGDAVPPRSTFYVSIFELAILVMIFVGFFGLILYVAKHARSGDK